jgi:CheY-like chemotaxis protein
MAERAIRAQDRPDRPQPPARILVAEDDASLREALKEVLSIAGYRLDLVDDGVRALESALADPPDLIILDHMMPGLDGLGVLRKLRADSRLQRTPVIFLTGAAQDFPAEHGAAAVIEKPFRMTALQDTVRSLLAAQAG